MTARDRPTGARTEPGPPDRSDGRVGPGEASLAALGEPGLIERMTRGRRMPPGVPVGPGDDAAVLAAPDGRTVVSTDMLVQDRHFRLDWSAPHDIGRKAIAVNAADIEAMGAVPTAFVVAFGAPPHTPSAHALELSDGMWAEVRTCGGAIVGGDVVAAGQWVVSVTALGDLGGRAPVLLGGAGVGDTVAVMGDLGRSAAGYALLCDGRLDDFDELRRAHLVPSPPYGSGRAAADAGATAMTDVSDGLVVDAGHLARASGVRLDLDAAALDRFGAALTAAAELLGADPRDWVLGGGEDHALLACFPAAPPEGWTTIGAVRAGAGEVLLDGRPWAGATGWQSF